MLSAVVALLVSIGWLILWAWVAASLLVMIVVLWITARGVLDVTARIHVQPHPGSESFECLACGATPSVTPLSRPPDLTDGPCPACGDGPLLRLRALTREHSIPKKETA